MTRARGILFLILLSAFTVNVTHRVAAQFKTPRVAAAAPRDDPAAEPRPPRKTFAERCQPNTAFVYAVTSYAPRSRLLVVDLVSWRGARMPMGPSLASAYLRLDAHRHEDPTGRLTPFAREESALIPLGYGLTRERVAFKVPRTPGGLPALRLTIMEPARADGEERHRWLDTITPTALEHKPRPTVDPMDARIDGPH